MARTNLILKTESLRVIQDCATVGMAVGMAITSGAHSGGAVSVC